MYYTTQNIPVPLYIFPPNPCNLVKFSEADLMGAGEGCLLLKRGFLSGDFGICEKLSAVGILSFYAGPFSSSLDITHFFNVFKMAEMKNKTYSKLFKDRILVLFRAKALIHVTLLRVTQSLGKHFLNFYTRSQNSPNDKSN